MTPEAQKIAIIKAIGWHQKEIAKGSGLFWHDPKGTSKALYEIPNYLGNLNACAEFEATLTTRKMQDEYSYEIARMFVNGDTFDVITATAPQRCEAFLRVKALWIKENTE